MAFRFARGLASKNPRERPSLLRVTAVLGVLAGIALLTSQYMPWPAAATAPAVVEYEPLHIVRAYSPGFVKEIPVANMDVVQAGQVLAVLENDTLVNELADAELALEETQLNLRVYRNQQDSANEKAESERMEALQKRVKEKREQVERLTVRAPVGGRVLTRRPEVLLGKYLRPGSEIVAIGDEQSKELKVSIAQDDVDDFSGSTGKLVDVRVGDSGRFAGNLSRIEPRASLELVHPALAASSGGPLLVKPKDRHAQDDDSAAAEYEWLAPRLAGRITLTSQQSASLGAGQLGVVSVRTSRDHSLIGHISTARLTHWCRDRARQLRHTLAGA